MILEGFGYLIVAELESTELRYRNHPSILHGIQNKSLTLEDLLTRDAIEL